MINDKGGFFFNADFFAIEPTNGRIRVDRSLLRNSGTYVFHIMARDEGGSGPFNSTAKVTIIVLEATNSPPEWTIPPLDNMTINVLEVCHPNKFKVIHLSQGRVYWFLMLEFHGQTHVCLLTGGKLNENSSPS